MAAMVNSSIRDVSLSIMFCGLLFVLGVFTLTGCITTVGPDYAEPEVLVPDLWHQELTQNLTLGELPLDTWWGSFSDPVLVNLIELASEGSLNLKEASSRIFIARAMLGISASELFPKIDAMNSHMRTRTSAHVVPDSPKGRTNWMHSYGVGIGWEIDLWGRIRRSIESAEANYEASIENYRDVLVVLYSDVAENYILIRTLQSRLRYAHNNIKIQRKSLKLTKERVKAELSPKLDVHQAEANLAGTESLVPQLKMSLAGAINRLAVLLGKYPSDVYPLIKSVEKIPQPPGKVILGIPAEVVRQRPDVRRAERLLAAQVAQIGVAEADLYPDFSLSGEFAFASEGGNMSDLFNKNSISYGFGPAFRWNIFDGNKIRNNVRIQEAKATLLLAQYEQTVLRAVEDVENAMIGFVEGIKRRKALSRAVRATAKSAKLVRKLYVSGLTDFQNVLDTERDLSTKQDQLAESEGEVSLSLVSLYRALGGSWIKTENLRELIYGEVTQ